MAKKAKKAKGPKKIGGVKIPKELRGAAAAIASHPVISDIVAAGLLAAAAALTDSRTGGKVARAVGDEVDDAVDDVAKKAGRAKTVVKAAAGAMGKAILDEFSGKAKPGRSGPKGAAK